MKLLIKCHKITEKKVMPLIGSDARNLLPHRNRFQFKQLPIEICLINFAKKLKQLGDKAT